MADNAASATLNLPIQNDSLHYFTCGNTGPWTAAFFIQSFLSVIGNSLIIWIVYKDHRLKTTINYFIANMAASDLLGAACLLATTQILWKKFDGRWIIDGDFGNALCKVFVFISVVPFLVSEFTCVFMAIDRFFAVVHPLQKRFQGKMRYIITGIWGMSCLFCGHRMYFFRTVEKAGNSYCVLPQNVIQTFIIYTYIDSALTRILPILFMAVMYGLAVYKLYKHKVPGIQTDSIRKRREKQNKKVLKLSATIVTLIYISFGCRYIFLNLYVQRKLDHLPSSTLGGIKCASLFILYMTLVYNFFICVIFNDIYRENIKDVIKCRFPCRRVMNSREAASQVAILGTKELRTLVRK